MNDDLNMTIDDPIHIIDRRSQIIDESTVPGKQKRPGGKPGLESGGRRAVR
jgi:hypothetical protein